jgi:hypothetical protein
MLTKWKRKERREKRKGKQDIRNSAGRSFSFWASWLHDQLKNALRLFSFLSLSFPFLYLDFSHYPNSFLLLSHFSLYFFSIHISLTTLLYFTETLHVVCLIGYPFICSPILLSSVSSDFISSTRLLYSFITVIQGPTWLLLVFPFLLAKWTPWTKIIIMGPRPKYHLPTRQRRTATWEKAQCICQLTPAI